MSKRSSRSANVNKVIGELALCEAVSGAKFTKLRHFPGVSNERPDAPLGCRPPRRNRSQLN